MASSVDSATFRALCGRFATGVVVVTAADANDQPVGMTANSFTSVSLDPPLVSVNVDRQAEFHPVILGAGGFAINVLGHDQESLSRRFANPRSDRFEGVGYRRTERGLLALSGAITTIECEIFDRIPVGDHTIVVGRVVGGEARDGRPLLYFRGGYHILA
ncbi:MAG: flavin reductase family protein [Gemmatimonadales bacterium]